uniref:Glucosylceramidase n=1 Tax=Hucho hucho TaxID=62062 RepID=A0A4W5JUB2_9TELE
MKIPLLQRAQALSPRPLSLLASAWSAPAWLKTYGALTGKGSLKGQPGGKEHKTWAKYYVRFLEEYAKYNLSLWAMTTGNEPSAGQMTNYSFQALGFTAEEQRDWVGLDLGSALHTSTQPPHTSLSWTTTDCYCHTGLKWSSVMCVLAGISMVLESTGTWTPWCRQSSPWALPTTCTQNTTCLERRPALAGAPQTEEYGWAAGRGLSSTHTASYRT